MWSYRRAFITVPVAYWWFGKKPTFTAYSKKTIDPRGVPAWLMMGLMYGLMFPLIVGAYFLPFGREFIMFLTGLTSIPDLLISQTDLFTGKWIRFMFVVGARLLFAGIFAGFVFGKWWGILIVLTATTIGATILYILAGYFFRDIIEEKLAPKFSKLKKFFIKNDILYFMSYRFIGGGGTPYAIQNVLPILFNMSVKNYVIATFVGSMPSMFVTVALGNGIERVIDQNVELSISTVLFSPEIYIPMFVFFILFLNPKSRPMPSAK